MLLKSIELKNFRQFINERLEFSKDKDKNVTIVFGDNGTGKTTLEQAFLWCFYGDNVIAFKDKRNMINSSLMESMKNKESRQISVEIAFEHKSIPYIIKRSQTYTKKSSDSFGVNNTVVELTYKNIKGETEILEEDEAKKAINEILPEELSKYFFFDGERIESLGKEIQGGNKSDSFKKATERLLGLEASRNALYHMNPNSKYGVIGSYYQELDSAGDETLKKKIDELSKETDRMESIKTEIPEIEQGIRSAEIRIASISEQLKTYEEAEEYQRKKEELTKEINRREIEKKNKFSEAFNAYRQGSFMLFSKSLMEKAIYMLQDGDYTNKGVPDVTNKTIQFILNRNKCICGNNVTENNEAYKKLLELLEAIPPQSIGNAVSDFIKSTDSKLRDKNDEARNKVESAENAYLKFDKNISKIDAEIKVINEKLRNVPNDTIKNLHFEQSELVKIKNNNVDKKDDKNKELGKLEQKTKDLSEEIDKLTNKNKKNENIKILSSYAFQVYKTIEEELRTKEKSTRSELDKNINEIFKEIYDGGLSIKLDDKYRISVTAESNEFIQPETSTAQSISVVLSFISAVIKMIREDKIESEKEEAYPLVMDAPLSAFDKTRIKSICNVIPQIAEQVIIFIKDTDGDIAMEHLKNKIGKTYRLKKKDNKDEFNTVITQE